jgi:NAD(P)-dependent dehydrogenase (short-subunit alcohol dehydrogenase family)
MGRLIPRSRMRHGLPPRVVRSKRSTPFLRRSTTNLWEAVFTMSGRLTDKIVIITGAGSGQGRAGAVLFAREGAKLALCDVDMDGLAETVEIVAKETDIDCLSLRCDLASTAEIETFVRATARHFNAIDVIYNNAGVMLRRSIEDTSEQDWDSINDINSKAPAFMVKYALPELMKSGSASVINVSSIAGWAPAREGNTAYCASKGALIALTRAQARDLAPYGIRVNCLLPGLVDTPMPAGVISGLPVDQQAAARTAAVSRAMIKRFGTAEEVAAVAVFLASAEASYMTGTIIPVDGGWTAS